MMNKPLTEPAKKRGRKSETPAEKLARLERDIAVTRQAVAKAETRRLASIGSAVIAEASHNPQFHAELSKLLRSRITGKGALADIEQLLSGKEGSAKNEPASPAE